jgi:hypothetical protein
MIIKYFKGRHDVFSDHSVKIKERYVHSQLVMTSSGNITNDIGGIDANYSLQSAEMSFFIIT